jgi:alkanesulfonate monooxygenase SsuD/methylene tetrahydromethanopterin reductase-like flavin-dependent oxidoreductase (luciferase family)
MDIELVANYTSASVDPREFARMAEANGFDGVGCSDHLFRTTPYPHLWVAASAMAHVTERVFVTSSFANNLFRSPAEFAQASLTMQWLSGGRFEAGLGAGWLQPEVVGAGLDYPDAPGRARRYREAMLIVRELFDTGRCTFEGEHYSVDLPMIGPLVAGPPPLVASVGGPWTIRHVSPIADRVELKFGRSTRGGDLDGAALATSTRADLAAMVEQVRSVAPDVPIGAFTMIAVGDRTETDDIKGSLGDGLYADFVGEPAEVLDRLLALGELGIDRVQVTERLAGSVARLGTVAGAR